MFVEILPNVLGPILVEFTVRLGYAIFTVATLSFLGFGIQPPTPDWGADISNNYQYLAAGYWWEVLFPALAIASLVVAVNLVADSIEAVVDPVTSDAPRHPGQPPLTDRPAGRRRARRRRLTRCAPGPAYGQGRLVPDRPQESFGLVGESGCGKTTMALAIDRYLARNGRVSRGSITVAGQDVMSLARTRCASCGRGRSPWSTRSRAGRSTRPSGSAARWRRCSRSPAREVGGGRAGRGVAAHGADQRSRAGAAAPIRTSYPAACCSGWSSRWPSLRSPALLILDEPTTALDATVEAEVLELVSQLREEFRHRGAVHQPQPRGDRARCATASA